MDLTMGAMARRLVAILLLVLAGCSADGGDPLPAACLGSGREMARALEPAPRPVTLSGGTRLSSCLRDASTGAELQSLGVSLTTVAGTLQRRAAGDPAAAGRLGYLIGAARRGAAAGNGVAMNLVRRLERTGMLESAAPAAQSALQHGLRAGESSG